MSLDQRVEALERLAKGEMTLRDFASIDRGDLDALAHLGRVAFESGRYDQAAQIFGGLEQIEPDVPAHTLRRAHAEHRAGQSQIALECLDRYIDREEYRPKADLQEAMLLRASLLRRVDPEAAALDVQAAQLLAGDEGRSS